MTERRHPMLLGALGLVAAAVILLECTCLLQSRSWLRAGDEAMEAGRTTEALDAWRAAASWQAPVNPWRVQALERLEAVGSAPALRRLRGAVLASTMSPSRADRELLDRTGRRLAAARTDLAPALWAEPDARTSPGSLLAVLSLLAFLAAGHLMVRAGRSTSSVTLDLARSGIVLGLALLVLVGLYLAP